MKQGKRKQWIAWLFLTAILGVFLCGCANDAVGEPQTTVTEAASEEEMTRTEEEPIVLGNNSKTLMYFNDPGHISNQSPYNPSRSTVVTKERLVSAVEEATTAGFDVFVNEVYGMVPWYPSELYSVEEHLDWFYNEYGGSGSNPFLTYTKNGNDFMKVQEEATHEAGKLFFISYRMNDHHGMNLLDNPSSASVIWTSKFQVEHPEYRIKQVQNGFGLTQYMLDFQYEEVREYKLAMIQELINNYDIDGLLLDFLRSPAYFNLSTTTAEQREQIITEFVAKVKAMLDAKSAQTGKAYYFGVVIPLTDTINADCGINVDMLYDAGVRIFTFWDYYMTVQDYDWLEEVKSDYPDIIAYAEVSQATSYLPGSNPNQVRYTTKEQYYTSAYTAYAHGADGLAVFNFAFYRNWQYAADPKLGNEPPFEIINDLKNTELLKSAAQHYFIGHTYNYINYDFALNTAFLTATKSMTFQMDMIPPEGGWTTDGILKLEATTDISNVTITVKVNGVTVAKTAYTGEPYNNPYEGLIGTAAQIQCFTVPSYLLETGENTFEVTADVSGNTAIQLRFIDLAIQ